MHIGHYIDVLDIQHSISVDEISSLHNDVLFNVTDKNLAKECHQLFTTVVVAPHIPTLAHGYVALFIDNPVSTFPSTC